MPDSRMMFAKRAENAACLFLQQRGYTILEKNFRTGNGEIDIISRQDDTIVFVEVKARNNKKKGSPREAVNSVKQKKIITTATHFLRRKKIVDTRVRFDVLSMIAVQGGFHIEHITNAFQEV